MKLPEEDEEEERWAKHYSSLNQILLVGDGDFSFSLSLATTFGSASNITATSFDSEDTVVAKYSKVRSNLESLKKMGATIIHGIDARKMKHHPDLQNRRFDQIVFNFPHAGFKGSEDHMRMINSHRQLVQDFFNSARHMLKPNGEVHVSHKTEEPYNKWKLESLASKSSLVLMECTDFNINDYPGYNNKRGDGVNCDKPFRLGKCATFKFVIGDVHGKKKACKKKARKKEASHMGSFCEFSASGLQNVDRIFHPLSHRYPQADCMFNAGPRPLPTNAIDMRGIPQRPNFVIELEGSRRTVYSPTKVWFSNLSRTHTFNNVESIPRGLFSSPSIGAAGMDYMADMEGMLGRVYPPGIESNSVSHAAWSRLGPIWPQRMLPGGAQDRQGPEVAGTAFWHY